MGSPEFAIPTFTALSKNPNYLLVGLYCQPDKKKGRGQKLCATRCKEFALEQNIPVFQPHTLKDDAVFENYKSLKPDLTLVVAYGKIIPERFLELPVFSTFNVHSSLLPELRGAAPINWAIARGYQKTGITIFKIAKKLDSGDIVFQKELQIKKNETATELYERLSRLSREIICDVLDNIFSKNITFTPQDDSKASTAPIIKKCDGKINFALSGNEIFNLIRGFSPWPGTYAIMKNKIFKILSGELLPLTQEASLHKTGSLFDLQRGYVRLSDSVLKLTFVQLEGKKPMNWETFRCGLKRDDENLILL